jgi:GTPase SAR1 family protein
LKLREADLVSADVIVVVYSIDDTETFNSIKTQWMPRIRKIRAGRPVRFSPLVTSRLFSPCPLLTPFSLSSPSPSHLLPYFFSLFLPHTPLLSLSPQTIPVILVGNKIDLRGSDTSSKTLEDDVMPIMTEFKEIETCIETSAKKLLNVQEVFYFAQKSVLYPTAPLYDLQTKQLEDRCVVALR